MRNNSALSFRLVETVSANNNLCCADSQTNIMCECHIMYYTRQNNHVLVLCRRQTFTCLSSNRGWGSLREFVFSRIRKTECGCRLITFLSKCQEIYTSFEIENKSLHCYHKRNLKASTIVMFKKNFFGKIYSKVLSCCWLLFLLNIFVPQLMVQRCLSNASKAIRWLFFIANVVSN